MYNGKARLNRAFFIRINSYTITGTRQRLTFLFYKFYDYLIVTTNKLFYYDCRLFSFLRQNLINSQRPMFTFLATKISDSQSLSNLCRFSL